MTAAAIMQRVIRMRLVSQDPKFRVLESVRFDTTRGCWEYTGADNMTAEGRLQGFYLPRKVYVYFRGPFASSLEIDHLCRNKMCLNPWHYDTVTRAVNMWRRYNLSPAEHLALSRLQ